MSAGGPQRQIGDHEFRPSKRGDSCDFTNWQADGPWLVCDSPRAAHQSTTDQGQNEARNTVEFATPAHGTRTPINWEIDYGKTHFVGDDCQPVHDPFVDAAAPGWTDIDTLRSDSGWTHGTGDRCDPPHTAEEWHDMHRPEDAAAEWKRMYDGKVAELAALQRTVEMQTALVTATAGVVSAAREIAATDFNNPFLPRYKAINAVIDALAALDKVTR